MSERRRLNLQKRARHIANYLSALTPEERAIVLSEAQAWWDEDALRGQTTRSFGDTTATAALAKVMSDQEMADSHRHRLAEDMKIEERSDDGRR